MILKSVILQKKLAWNRLFLTEINILPPDLPPGASKKSTYFLLRFGY